MSIFARDLLTLAETLTQLDRRRPKQATLRRAVSTAYYALFHLLTDAASRRLTVGGAIALQHSVQRAFSHADMRKVCLTFRSGGLPPEVAVLFGAPLSPDVRFVANAFAILQQERHAADYDMTRSYTRSEVAAVLEQAQNAFDAWERIKTTDEARVFLASLLLWDRWKRS